MEKKKRAMLTGRLAIIHNGHEQLIDISEQLSEELLIFVGSAQEQGTVRNPFSANTRIKMIKAIYPQDNIIVRPLNDLTHEDDITVEWGKYLLRKSIEVFNDKPQLMVYGNDEARSNWFDKQDIKDMTEIIVSRHSIPISATQCRFLMAINNKDEWCKYHNPAIHKYFEELREELLWIKYYREIFYSNNKGA